MQKSSEQFTNELQNLDIATEEQKEKIKEIESLNIRPGSKAELILVILGVKPATNVEIRKKHDSPERVKQTLTKCGLFVEEMLRKHRAGGHDLSDSTIVEFAISKNENFAKQLAQLDPSKTEDNEAFGTLMGFPKSAVRGFKGEKGKRLDKKKYPPVEDLAVRYRLSEEGWKNEIIHLKYWSDLIKKYSPATYQKIINE